MQLNRIVIVNAHELLVDREYQAFFFLPFIGDAFSISLSAELVALILCTTALWLFGSLCALKLTAMAWISFNCRHFFFILGIDRACQAGEPERRGKMVVLRNGVLLYTMRERVRESEEEKTV